MLLKQHNPYICLKVILGLLYEDNSKIVLQGGVSAAKYFINAGAKIKESIAVANIEFMRIDIDLPDIMVTWNQLSGNYNLTDYVVKVKLTNSRKK